MWSWRRDFSSETSLPPRPDFIPVGISVYCTYSRRLAVLLESTRNGLASLHGPIQSHPSRVLAQEGFVATVECCSEPGTVTCIRFAIRFGEAYHTTRSWQRGPMPLALFI